MKTAGFARWAFIGLCVATGSVALGQGGYDAPRCPIADAVPRTAGNLSIGLVGRQTVQGNNLGSFGLVEIRSSAEVAYFYGSAGPVSMTALFNAWMPSGGELANLPYQFGQLALHVQGDYRTWSGLTLRGELQPGLYSDLASLKANALSCPIGLSVIQAFNPNVALQAGVVFTPGFHRTVDALLGVRWILNPNLTLDLFYPESQLLWQLTPDWAFVTQLAIARQYDFFMNDHGTNDRFRLEENRISLGTDFTVADNVLLMFRTGMLMDRRLAFKKNAIGNRKVDDGIFFSLGLGVTF